MNLFQRFVADRLRGALWWAFGMVVAVGSVVGLWPTVRDNDDIEKLVEDLPEGVRAMIGLQQGVPLSSAPGYLQARLFSTVLPMLLVVYAIGLGARVIGGAEEDGTLQLVVTAPVTRRRVASRRLAASVVLAISLVVTGLVTAVVLGGLVGIFSGEEGDDDVSVGRLLLSTAAVTELAVLHLALAFAVGAVAGRRGSAVSVAGAFAVGGYVLHGLAASAHAIQPFRIISAWWWLLDRNLLVQDPTFLSLGLPILISVLLVVIGIRRFEQRDLRFP